ncbi:MAG: NAD-dependent deacylase [Bacteroidales bacterium]|nr:NAD-dependent deacylase [Bacteroidales bacterium]
MGNDQFEQVASLLKKSRFTTAYTGAGISVESGIPPFRGVGGIWSKYDPASLEIGYFLDHPKESWEVIKKLFYNYFQVSKPNKAHLVLTRMEMAGMLSRIITQNIDNLHQEAGSHHIFEFHGNSNKLICLTCHRNFPVSEINMDHLPPTCRECGGLLKPDFVFFGEAIPQLPLSSAYEAAGCSDVFLIIGTTGEVMPANQIPPLAKQNGATIIEINTQPSNYTPNITDIFLQGKASEMMGKIEEKLFSPSLNNN